MSHFIGLCFGNYWEDNLEKYNENIRVEPYIEYTKEEAIDEVKLNHAHNYEKALEILSDPEISSEIRLRSEKIIESGLFISWEDAWKEAKEWGYVVDEENECLLSTYNPDSKWDWYIIGGRWDGYLPLIDPDSEGNKVFVNTAMSSDIDWDYVFKNDLVPFCYVTEEGEWCECAKMGYWAITTDEKDPNDWTNEFKTYVKSLDADCLVTAVDFHI
jgi:hypothetical protein